MPGPQSVVKSKFGEKAKLVAELEKFTKDEALWVGRVNESKGLAHVSNAKLLKLHATFTAVKEKFGTRAKLIDAIAEIEKRTKDDGFKKGLSAYPVPRLYDMYLSAQKRSAPKAPKAVKAAKAAKTAAVAAKAVAKKVAAKKPVAKKPAKKK